MWQLFGWSFDRKAAIVMSSGIPRKKKGRNTMDVETAFELILHAGNAKGYAMKAVKEARKFHFEKAEELLKEAKKEEITAHQVQTDMLQKEANGLQMQVNLITVHAQDHLNGATIAYEQAEELIHVYRLLASLMNTEEEE